MSPAHLTGEHRGKHASFDVRSRCHAAVAAPHGPACTHMLSAEPVQLARTNATFTMPAEIITRPLHATDLPLVSRLHARVFGPGRFARSAYRLREGTAPVSRFCRGAFRGDEIIAALRMTEVTVGGKGDVLLLGPLAVDQRYAGQGHGRRLVADALESARGDGKQLVVLVGDMPYYGRFGFVVVPPGQIVFPGPVNPARVLAAELVPGALAGYRGLIAARSA